MSKLLEPDANPRGIPRSPFIENIEEFMSHQESADTILRLMSENYSKYKFMEDRLTSTRDNLKVKIPDIQKTLEMVNYLVSKKEAGESFTANYELGANVYANAQVTPSVVCLWLGANVMVEYTFEEATALLAKNLEAAERNMRELTEDLEFLKDQITTTQVNTARIFNFDVKQRRLKKKTEQIQTGKA
eukprot:TRINITY_DN3513_c0_g1_i1.p1 TRINITY_DN3513_c0_g1~~TRINITY_DN3513_c0_g1_i1.p1  ORF type:complete len:188 (-),score=33.80 TRINITY_DN3513_c0_g1_i1:32-595(-)